MQISGSAYMSVETLVRLAAQGADKPCTTQGLAESINRSVSYTESLMARLRGAGLVVSRHGRGGGYVLAKPAQRITVAEIFRAVDEPTNFASRPATARGLAAARIPDLQAADHPWEALKSRVLSFLNDISLADLALRPAEAIGKDDNERADMRWG
ncbi:RrF2 family transcriptional regulator [Algihabitans albus]|uniref:RrF2 family transcriptional regulator n=1 Tax=Algihabitans albus TaxID=2164067 RepID=UPI000E5CFDBA|nr:Rrf2 family transcriptional regulator [Algihabitans albus]